MNAVPENDASASSPDRVELLCLGVLVAATLAVRLAHFDRMSVEHFDEGVYVSNLWFGADDGYRYPYRHIYAPPLVPALLEWSMILLGPGTWGTMLPGLLLGTATVPLAWLAGREWFGRWAGWTSAVLVAFADQHVLFSRTALVDVPLNFFLLLAVWLVWRAYTRDSWRWAVAAGIATGLAWSTKYNGWLPLAIGLAGGLPWVVFGRNDESSPKLLRNGLLWLIVAVVAGLVWSPALRDLQPRGGYTAVASAQAGYVVGLTGWPTAFRQQMQNVWWTGRSLAGVALLLVAAIPFCAATRSVDVRRLGIVSALFVVAGGLLVLWGTGVLLLVLGTGLAGMWVVQESLGRRSPPNQSAAKWLLAAWFFGLLVATPFYTSYPRLLLPWLLAGWMIAGAGMEWLVRELSACEAGTERAEGFRGRLDVAALGVLATSLFAWLYFGPTPPAWDDRTGIERAFPMTSPRSVRRPTGLLLTFAEPAAFHHSNVHGENVAPAGSLENALTLAERLQRRRMSVILVVGENGRRTPGFEQALAENGDRVRLIREMEITPSRVVALNLFAPDELAQHSGRPTYRLQVYAIEP